MASSFKQLFKKISRMQRELPRAQVFKEMAPDAVEIIRKRTKRGYGVSEDGEKQVPLKKLGKKWKRVRERNASSLAGDTSPGKSNLTFSGDMLKSLYAKKVSKNIYEVTVGDEYIKIAEGQKAQGRNFLALTLRESNKLVKDVGDGILDIVRRIFG